jgi:hypothetical protein
MRSIMRQSTVFETIAKKLLDRQGIQVIWLLHLKASASHTLNRHTSSRRLTQMEQTQAVSGC